MLNASCNFNASNPCPLPEPSDKYSGDRRQGPNECYDTGNSPTSILPLPPTAVLPDDADVATHPSTGGDWPPPGPQRLWVSEPTCLPGPVAPSRTTQLPPSLPVDRHRLYFLDLQPPLDYTKVIRGFSAAAKQHTKAAFVPPPADAIEAILFELTKPKKDRVDILAKIDLARPYTPKVAIARFTVDTGDALATQSHKAIMSSLFASAQTDTAKFLLSEFVQVTVLYLIPVHEEHPLDSLCFMDITGIRDKFDAAQFYRKLTQLGVDVIYHSHHGRAEKGQKGRNATQSRENMVTPESKIADTVPSPRPFQFSLQQSVRPEEPSNSLAPSEHVSVFEDDGEVVMDADDDFTDTHMSMEVDVPFQVV
ncbi:hypothetical protein H257_05838 [Aphanomyces astaci]|uniref:Uncharacterized protein n=1 Tax=Aphanomyces astaci TaxID=112090 RepID=W4GQH8_APHAT|nr:hypothetical protein H257_05838 [Aphanomyces astaci]ETV81274.1 hypothetical protein H257_05838 [Aphanomyces astaci]|eukprot:XP_009829132.1 hypothetical protein H257_05838 [Aphanomyces astaci]